MGFLRPRPDTDDTPLIRGDGETSFIVPAPSTSLGGPHRKVLKALGFTKPGHGDGSERFDVVIQRFRTGAARFTYDGHILGVLTEGEGYDLVKAATNEAGTRVIRARAYIYRRQEDGAYGIRVYLPARH